MTRNEYSGIWREASYNILGFAGFSDLLQIYLGIKPFPDGFNVLSVNSQSPLPPDQYNHIAQFAGPYGKILWRAYCLKHDLDPRWGHATTSSLKAAAKQHMPTRWNPETDEFMKGHLGHEH